MCKDRIAIERNCGSGPRGTREEKERKKSCPKWTCLRPFGRTDHDVWKKEKKREERTAQHQEQQQHHHHTSQARIEVGEGGRKEGRNVYVLPSPPLSLGHKTRVFPHTDTS